MTREEHLAWAKKRALEYLDGGDLGQAVTSMLSDLRKHAELAGHPGARLGSWMYVRGLLTDPQVTGQWIEQFR